MKYKALVIAYKSSGKSYASTCEELGEFTEYPATIVYNFGEKLEDYNYADKMLGLANGTIESNNFSLLYIVTDSSDDPICFSRWIKK